MTPKQERFCQEYLIDCNGAAAARRAGYSMLTAAEQASQMLAQEEIANTIEHLMVERSKRVGINQDFVLSELVALARAGEGATKLRALELLGKHLHMFNERVDVNVNLAKKAEEYAKMPVTEQIELMKQEIKRLEAKNEPG